jgi:superfamily II DNA or RNA helicase
MNFKMLRPYQQKLFLDVRQAFRGRRSVLMQLPTGAGKTIIFSEMGKSSTASKRKVWIIVPRNELLTQASDSLTRIGVPHGRIDPRHQESSAFSLHVVSKDTLIRRYDKIKKHPDFIIVDEAHLALDRYMEIAERFPEAKILGVTATPERLDGKGLSDLYEVLVEGPTIQELINDGYLTGMSYFAPPIEGLNKVKRAGTEYNQEELAQFLERRKIYGKAIDHYERHAKEKPTLVFCRSIKDAEETAHRFQAAGYDFESVDGRMSYKKRKALIDGLREGTLQGLTSCELVTYGLDVPRVECVIMLRPTLSRALYMQMIGRGLRPYAGKHNCIVLDHVGNLQEHGVPWEMNDWRFNGREKRPRVKSPMVALKLCPELDFLYCDKPSCAGCEHNRSGRKERKLELVEGSLKEIKSPVKYTSMPPDQKLAYEARISEAVEGFARMRPGAVGDMLKIADELGKNPLWVYFKLSGKKSAVDVTLLHEIARLKKYKRGWVWFQKNRIQQMKGAKNHGIPRRKLADYRRWQSGNTI